MLDRHDRFQLQVVEVEWPDHVDLVSLVEHCYFHLLLEVLHHRADLDARVAGAMRNGFVADVQDIFALTERSAGQA